MGIVITVCVCLASSTESWPTGKLWLRDTEFAVCRHISSLLSETESHHLLQPVDLPVVPEWKVRVRQMRLYGCLSEPGEQLRQSAWFR